MKKLDLVAIALLVVGGLNWGLVSIARFDLVAAVFGLDFGQTNAASRLVYGLVGLSAVYLLTQVRAVSQRWAARSPAMSADRRRHRPLPPAPPAPRPEPLPPRKERFMGPLRTLPPARGIAAVALAGTVALTLGCSSGGTQTERTNAAGGATAAASAASAEAPRPFGPACSKVPASGPGSLADMAGQPVATAAARNPLLSTLATAVIKAGLVDTLNRAEALTVFAPTNDAFAKIPPATLNKVLADKKTLTSILTYHVVAGRHGPSDLADGRFKTLQGGTVTTAKKGDSYTVEGARVVCGNVQTRNATVYLIDTVLMPEG